MSDIQERFKKKIKKLQYFHMYDTTRALLRKEPLYPLNDRNNSNQPFFIIGSGRSGNTLLRSMLVEGKGVVIPPESYVIGSVIRKYYDIAHFKNFSWSEICALVLACFDEHPEFKWWKVDTHKIYNRLKGIEAPNKNLAFILEQIYLEYANQNDIEFITWGDKTPINAFHLEKIHQTFPKAKFIHLIRDGRDVAVSYKKSGLYKLLEEGCKRWNDSIQYIQEFSRTISSNQICEVKYENLVTNTKEELIKISEFLEIPYTEDMIYRSNNKILGDVEGLSHHSNVTTKVNSSSIGKWKKDLTQEEQEFVNKFCSHYLGKFNYI